MASAPSERRNLTASCLFSLALLMQAMSMAAPRAGRAEESDAPSPITIRGRVVYLAEALERLHGIKSVREAAERTLAIESPDGQLTPLVEDVRGRAFRVDERLRKLKDVELSVRRHPQSPAVQIVRVYAYEGGKRFELDYWCEICAIAMFELKPCDCCQGDIELRRRPAPKP